MIEELRPASAEIYMGNHITACFSLSFIEAGLF